MLMSLTSGGSALYQKGGGGGLESLRYAVSLVDYHVPAET